MKKLALIAGVGAINGLGGALCRKFAENDYHVIVSGRTQEKINDVAQDIKSKGHLATAKQIDVTDEKSVLDVFHWIDKLEDKLNVVSYNAGNASSGNSLEMSCDDFEAAWKVGCFGGFLLGREALKRLSNLGTGTLFYTGATASLRGRPPYLPFASAKAGLRSVAQTYAREFSPKGIHVAHIIIDGGIDGDKLKQRYPQIEGQSADNRALNPDDIAQTYWTLHQQPANAWTFECDLRPALESF